jgi:hypothetical protein
MMPAGARREMKAKPWQIAIIALAFVAVGAAAAYMFSGSGPDVPTRITLIDVTTGQLYDWDMKRYRVALPAPEPASREYRLVPVLKKDGVWELTGNGRSMLKGITAKITAVNAKTGEVVQASADVKEYVPPGA